MYEDKKIALVLSGGGAKGAYQSAVIKTLDDRLGLKYEVVAGVSVGALNGTMVAQNKIQQMYDIWLKINNGDVYEKHSIIGKAFKLLLHKIGISEAPMGLKSNKPLQQLIEKHVNFDDLVTDLLIGKVSINDFRYSSSITKKNFVKEVLASTAIPIVWEPTKIGEQSYVDGGIRNVTPLSDVLSYNPDLIIIIPNRTFIPHKLVKDNENPKSILHVAKRTMDIMMDEIFQEDVNRLFQINELVKQAEHQGATLTKKNGMPYKHYETVIISPFRDLGDALDFENSRMLRINTGINRANQSIERIQAKLENG